MTALLGFLTSKVGRYVVLALAIAIALIVIVSRIYKAGEDHADNAHLKKGLEDIQKAETGRRSVDDCYALGGVWRRETGTCVWNVP